MLQDILNNKEIQKHLIKLDEEKTEIYHGLNHTLNVIENINKLCKLLNITKQEQEELIAAAYLHDLGHKKGKENHPLLSKEYAIKYLNIDNQKILKAIEKHHEKDQIDELTLFEHILLFSDKIDITKKRINKNYKEYAIQKDILNIDFLINDDTFIIKITTNNLSIDDLNNWNHFPKILKRIEEFSKKLNKIYKIEIIN